MPKHLVDLALDYPSLGTTGDLRSDAAYNSSILLTEEECCMRTVAISTRPTYFLKVRSQRPCEHMK